MKKLLVIFLLISSSAIAQTHLHRYYFKVTTHPANISKKDIDSTVTILTKRLSKQGYQNAAVAYDTAIAKFVVTTKDVLDSTYILFSLIKPFRLFIYETYSLKELSGNFLKFAADKRAKTSIESFVELIHTNPSNGFAHIGLLNLADTAKFRKVKTEINKYLPADWILAFPYKLSSPKDAYIQVYGLKENEAKMDVNAMLADCKVAVDYRGHPNIALSFNQLGTKWFAKITNSNVGRPIAIVIDNRVVTAPFVNGAVEGGNAEMSGNFTMEEAAELVSMFKAGSLPLSLGLAR